MADNPRLRIGIVVKHLDSRRGGLETYCTRLAHHLVAVGHDVHLFTEKSRDQLAGAHVHMVAPFRPATVERAASAQQLNVLLASGRAAGMNVLQPHGGTVPGTRRQALARYRSPLLRDFLSALDRLNPRYRIAVREERRQYSQLHPRPHFVAISQRVRDEMRCFYDIPEDRLHLLYNGVDTEAFCPERCASIREEARQSLGLLSREVCFLLVAHNFHLKGLPELIAASASLRRSDSRFRVVVVGRGNARRLARQARKLGCGDVLQFAGPTSKIIQAYAAADVYVHPTWYDACSLAVLEAWACGLPAITTRFNGAGELMTDGREGFLIDSPADTQGLAARMRELLDADRRRVMGRMGRLLTECNTEADNFRKLTKILELAAREHTGRIEVEAA